MTLVNRERGSLNVRSAPKATELLRRRELSRRANSRHQASAFAISKCIFKKAANMLQGKQLRPGFSSVAAPAPRATLFRWGV
jgi:hypothetical protein